MAVAEPLAERLTNPLLRYFLATRPPFLLASLVPVFIGLAVIHFTGVELHWSTAVLTLVGALLVHAAANVINDYYDDLNGTDNINSDRIYPFTGGSRFIQNRILTREQMGRFGLALLAAAVVIGLALLPRAGWGLAIIGLVGLVVCWAYSAPPLALNSRGLGEFCIALGFGTLIPLGTDFVQRAGFDPLVLFASAPYALLVTCLLYINEFPDRRADDAAGKHHLVVRLGPRRARWGYLWMVLLAYGGLIAMVVGGMLPLWALLGLIPLPLSLDAARSLVRWAESPAQLAPAIQKTIAAMVGHGLFLSLGLVLGGAA